MDKSAAKLLKLSQIEVARTSELDIDSRMHEPGIAMAMWMNYAKSDRKGVSNYDRTYVAATLSPLGLNLWDRAVNHFLRMTPNGCDMRVHDAQRVDVIFKFMTPDCKVPLTELDVDTPKSWQEHLEVRHSMVNYMIQEAIAEQIVPAYRAGKPIYGIHPALMMGVSEFESFTGERIPRATRERFLRSKTTTYEAWIRKVMERSFVHLRISTHRRIREQVRRATTNPDFLELKRQAILKQCCSDVADVLRRYSALGDDVLRSAVREYLVADSMEW